MYFFQQAALVIDGKVRYTHIGISYCVGNVIFCPGWCVLQSLTHAISPAVENEFLTLALSCKSVICCRCKRIHV